MEHGKWIADNAENSDSQVDRGDNWSCNIPGSECSRKYSQYSRCSEKRMIFWLDIRSAKQSAKRFSVKQMGFLQVQR